MGKIPTYQRDRFASSYVGGAQRDDSGALMTEAVLSGVEPIRKNEIEKLRAREKLLVDQKVNNSLIKYSLDVQKNAQKLQEEYSGNPTDYPDALNKMTGELAQSYMNGTPDRRVRDGLLKATTSMRQQMTGPAVKWAFKKQEEEALTAVKNSVETIILTTTNSMSTEELLYNAESVYDSIYNVTESEGASLLTSDQKDKEWEKYSKRLVETNLRARAYNDPEGVLKDMEEGKFDEMYVEGKRVPFTGKLKNTIEKAANSRINSIKTEIKDSQRQTYHNALVELADEVLTIDKILALQNSDDEYHKISDKDASTLLKGVFKYTGTRSSELAGNNEKAEKYLEAINKSVDSTIEANQLYEKIIDAFAEGVLPANQAKLLASVRDRIGKDPEAVETAKWLKWLNDTMGEMKKKSTETAMTISDMLTDMTTNNTPAQTAARKAAKSWIKRIPGVADLPKAGGTYVDQYGNKAHITPDGEYEVIE